jgi:membrane fusion protein (multidrug efflux system)
MQDTTPPSSNNNNGKRKRLLLGLAGIFLLAGAAYGVYWSEIGRYRQSTDDAYVAGNIVQIMPQVTGTVVSIQADETHLVRQGQPVITLDSTDAAVSLEQSKAELADAVRQVRQLYENVGQARANINLRKAELLKAQDDLQHRKDLLTAHAIPAEEVQHAQRSFDAAEAALRLAEHQLAAANAMVENTTFARHPILERAKTKVREAYLASRRTTLVSPVTGYVAKRSVQLGQRVTPEKSLMAIVPLNDIWVDANFKEVQLKDVRIGQDVTLASDFYGDDVRYHGKVLGISAGTGSTFTLLPPQNATGNWIKIVQRIPVRIALDGKELAQHPLRIGLSMRVVIDTHNTGGGVLAELPATQPAYATTAFNNELAPAEAVINQIIRANAGDTPDISAAGAH